ncbi:MAG TPA: hypothetical protein VKD69_24880 [Vicinamibacterales bacterium]|nr:hypothetical protein [Vicinamibacterales bacterium]
MHRSRIKRALAGWAIVGILAAIGGARRGTAPRAEPDHLTSAPTAVVGGAFRLGTAGRPFAWSTAIGDLNADGRPDFAIADRLGRRATGFAYAIELSIDGGGSASVQFDSDQDALNVTLRDVDRDRDLDVVVTGAVSRAVVAVWLNDGTGRFHRASPQAETASWHASPTELADSPLSDAGPGESIVRGATDAVAADRADGDVPPSIATLASCGAFRTAAESTSALRSRAPPHASA